MYTGSIRCFLCAIFLAGLTAPAARNAEKENGRDKITNRDVGAAFNFFSIEQQIALGRQVAYEVERQARIVTDPVISEYVNRIAQKLVRNSAAKLFLTVKVIDSREINAFALPGGFFFVDTGLILNADNEAEMAGLMATRMAAPLTFREFSANTESEADLLGLKYMYKAGYNPTAFVDFLEKMQSIEKPRPGSFSIHPPGDDRIKAAQQNIQRYLKEKPIYVLNTSEFEHIKVRTIGLRNIRVVHAETSR